jgi:hypothetical protein
MASQEPPEQEAAPVAAPNDTGTLALAQRTAVVSGPAPIDAGTPAPAGRTAQVHVKAPGPRAARPEVRGPRMARPRAPGPRSTQQGSPETVPACWGNLQGKDRQVTVAEPPGQSETESPARGQEKV